MITVCSNSIANWGGCWFWKHILNFHLKCDILNVTQHRKGNVCTTCTNHVFSIHLAWQMALNSVVPMSISQHCYGKVDSQRWALKL